MTTARDDSELANAQPGFVGTVRCQIEKLFQRHEPQYYEMGLLLLLANVIRDSTVAFGLSADEFASADAFGRAVTSVEPVGFACWLPLSLVLSQRFDRVVAIVSIVSAMLWATKRMPRISPACTVLGYGLLVSLTMSRMANYTHQMLPGVALLIPFAVFYFFHAHEIKAGIRGGTLWSERIYPQWVGGLCVCYLASLYTYGGINKILIGGSAWLSGEPLQILLVRHANDQNMLAQAIISSRTIAFASTILTVTLEAGAVVGLFFLSTRTIWAFGLILMHVVIQLTMRIDFKLYAVLLAWLCLPWQVVASPLGRLGIKVAGYMPKRLIPREGLMRELAISIDYFCVSAKRQDLGDQVRSTA